MLQWMHNKATGFFVKLLMGLLVASFALWGIGDIFRTTGSTTVAEVGSGAIGAQELKAALDKEVANYRRMLGDKYSPDLLKSIGIPNQVLDTLVQQHLVAAEVNDLGLSAPASLLIAQLRDTPAFRGEDGQFDAQRFRSILAANNLSENAYLSLLKKEAGADMLLQSVFSGIRPTPVAAKLAYLYENEERLVDMLVFKPELIRSAGTPTALELERFYEENASNFKAQEYRVFSLVTLDQDHVQKGLSISDEDVLIEYQSRIDEYREPEKREVRQLLYDDKETAQDALEALNAGNGLDVVAKEFKPSNASLQLGLVTASAMLPEAEEQVFALKKGEHTGLVESSFGWHIFEVTNIVPEHTRSLAEVKEALSADMRQQRAGEQAYELSNTLQDDLAGGATLEQAAESVDGAVQSFGPIGADSTSPDGTAIKLPEQFPSLLNTAFDLSEGEVSNIVETEDGSYYVLRVDSVLPERTRALDEVKGRVVSEWEAKQKEEKLYELATKASEGLSGQSAAAAAKSTGAKLVSGQRLTRASSEIKDNLPVPAMMLSAIFSAEAGAASEAYALPDGGYIVGKLTRIEKADPLSEAGKQALVKASDNLRAVYADDLYLQYMNYLRNKHGVSEPNQELIDSLLQ